MNAETLADVGEFALLAELTPGLPQGEAVRLGPGDDAAVIGFAGPVAVSTDVLVEGVHFRRDWSSADEIGRKAVAVNVADIEAMGVPVVALTLGFSAPGTLEADWVRGFFAGFAREAAAAGASLSGGDITSSRDVTVAVTVLGDCGGRRPVTRSGARPGDVVAVVGELGLAAAGLRALSRGFRSPRAAVERQRCPRPPYGQGVVANDAGATAMIDVSDGLLADLGHLAAASGVAIDLTSAAFAVPAAVATVAQATGVDPLDLVLGGGEDHALAATFPAGAVPDGWVVVGSVAASEAPGVTVDQETWTGTSGWDHYRR